MRTMVDCANAAYAPAGYPLYAGYVDGAYQSYPALKKRFPNALVVPIAVFPSTNAGTVFDGPPDNSTWPRVVDWVVMRRKEGVDPTVYTDADQWPVGVAAFNARGITPPHWWIASWNDHPDVPAGAVAHQYHEVVNRYDLSAVLDYWPGVDPKPVTPAPPHPPAPAPVPAATPLEDEMMTVAVTKDAATGADPGIWLLSGELYAHIPTIGDVQSIEATGVKRATISYAMHQNLVAAAAALQGKLTGSLNINGTLQAQ